HGHEDLHGITPFILISALPPCIIRRGKSASNPQYPMIYRIYRYRRDFAGAREKAVTRFLILHKSTYLSLICFETKAVAKTLA
ncbi:hypothetical protein, partial [Novosphingobium sp. Rr 2-17]|uniref:hypothetical protein n=1 Tax=Novosphingobium sp. Rr 2-17 TaxID=555793 RepID=UPI001ED8E3F0